MVRETLSAARRERPFREPGDARQGLVGPTSSTRTGCGVVLVEKLPNGTFEGCNAALQLLGRQFANQRSTRFSQEL